MTIVNVPGGSSIPLYRQVSEQLFRAIMGGEFAPGEALPTEHALCARYGVSRITVRRALDELAERHLVVRRRGAGNFVSDEDRGIWSVTLTGFFEEVLSPNRLIVVREDVVCPPPEVLRFARLPDDTKLKLFEGTNVIADGAPLMHLNYYFPFAIAGRLSAKMLSGASWIFKLAEQASGSRVDRAEQIALPMIANERIARFLDIEPGSAVLRIIRAYYDAQGNAIEVFDGAYHPTHYRYTATLYPRSGRGR